MKEHTMNPLIYLNYDLNKNELLKEANRALINSNPYSDSRYPNLHLEKWRIGHWNSKLIDKIMFDFEVKGKPRFYWLEPYAVIPEHIDNETECSLNFILTEDPAPINIEGKEYIYHQALLDTTRLHSVNNNKNKRIMLKISIFNESFSKLAKRIKYVYR
jgi:hypothetical protein